jgi:hypothetical protein
MEVCSPWPGGTTTSSGSVSTLARRVSSIVVWSPPGRVGATDRAREQQVAREHDVGDVVARTAYGR